MNRIRHIGVLAGAFVSISWIGTAAAAEWTVEESSEVKFSFLQQGSRNNGVFEEFDATIDFDPAKPQMGSIVGVVQTESVDTREYDRDATLTDPDWFDTSNHPEARFESQSIEKTDDGYVASGELTIKGKTNPTDMHFTFDTSDPSAAKFLGTMKVNRFDYNVGEGWNDTSWIGQDVDIEVALDLTK